MALSAAQPAEVLRAWQKDELYRSRFAASLARLLGASRASNAPIIASALYSACTTLRDLQTLGEEYSGIVQVDDSYNKLPSFGARSISLVLSIFGESISKNLLRSVEKRIESDNDLRIDARNFFIAVTHALIEMLPQLEKVHRAYCYIHGGSLQIGKTVAGIDYVQARPAAAAYYAHLRILGLVTFAHALIVCGRSFYRIRKDVNEMNEFCNESESTNTCVACLEDLGRPCVLPCGHVFCMQCCYGALESCALCRTVFTKNTVVPLQNYFPNK